MASRNEALIESLKAALGDKVTEVSEALGEVTLVVKASDLIPVMKTLRDSSDLRFEQLTDLAGVDYGSYGKVAWTGTPFSEGGANAPLAGPAPETDASPPIDEAAPLS